MAKWLFRFEVGPRDVDAASKSSIFSCVKKYQGDKNRSVACVQGAINFGLVARRKFEGFLTSVEDSNAVYHRGIKLCAQRFGPTGTPITDACDIGLWETSQTVQGIGTGRLRRMSGKKARR